jgi:response regulator NasT
MDWTYGHGGCKRAVGGAVPREAAESHVHRAMNLRILIVDEDDERGELLEQGLTGERYAIAGRVGPRDDLLAAVASVKPDIIIVNVDSPNRDMLEGMRAFNRDFPRPIVMFTHDGDPETIRAAIEAGVSAYVVDGLSPERVKPILEVSINRFRQFQALREELGLARSSLADRKAIERAKGLLMKRHGWSEEKAYRSLRRTAMNTNQRLIDVALKVVEMAELL